MRALVVREPHASRILSGEKIFETRTWSTDHRGPLLVCVSKKGGGNLGGKAVCVVNLLDCEPMILRHEVGACVKRYPRAIAWVLGSVTPIKPFKVHGRLGLFEVRATPAMLKPVELWEVQ